MGNWTVTASTDTTKGTPADIVPVSRSAYDWLVRSGDGRRLRTPWRLVVGAVIVVLVGAFGAAIAAAIRSLATGADPAVGAITGTAANALVAAALALGLVVAARLVDERSWAVLGVDIRRSRAWLADLAFGLALGVALPAVVFAAELAAGFVQVTGTLVSRPDASLPIAPGVDPWLALALVAAYFVAVAVFEELLFRAYLLWNLAEGLAWFDAVGPRRAVLGAAVVTSLFFGLGHAANPAATARGVALIACYGGLLAASVLLTGRLAVAVGFHLTWNLAVSSVFGFPVSGFTTPVTLVAVEQSGPVVLTGGRFGPEAGLVSLVGLVAGAAALVAWVRWREGGVRVRIPVFASPAERDGASPRDRNGSAALERNHDG